MPMAMKCSRCGTYYDDYSSPSKDSDAWNALYTASVTIALAVDTKERIDLCPDCKELFKAWLDSSESLLTCSGSSTCKVPCYHKGPHAYNPNCGINCATGGEKCVKVEKQEDNNEQ